MIANWKCLIVMGWYWDKNLITGILSLIPTYCSIFGNNLKLTVVWSFHIVFSSYAPLPISKQQPRTQLPQPWILHTDIHEIGFVLLKKVTFILMGLSSLSNFSSLILLMSVSSMKVGSSSLLPIPTKIRTFFYFLWQPIHSR